jgi:hypothetical protein
MIVTCSALALGRGHSGVRVSCVRPACRAPPGPARPSGSNALAHLQWTHMQGFGSESGFNQVSESGPGSVFWNPDPDPGGQKLLTKVDFFMEISCFEVLDVLFCELKASSVTWTSFMEV